MARPDPHAAGDAFCRTLDSFQRPLFLLAHHDDEIPTAGLLQRLPADKRVLWVTNSDGLYFESDRTPDDYGKLRMAEGMRSVAHAGVGESAVTNLGFSEVEIYRRFAWLHARRKAVSEVRPFFQDMRNRVREAVLDLKPDAVFTLAWQGGQPEHDLTHFLAHLALADLRRATGQAVPFFHMPAYEYTILVAMRFHPFYRGPRLRLRLSPEELKNKMAMMESYPSQVRLFADFRKVFGWIGKIGRLTGGPRTAEDYVSVEEFGPVPEGIDYTAKPHLFDYFTYMFDDFEGTPVTFKTSLRPLVADFLRDPG